jgi:hypothetical protein
MPAVSESRCARLPLLPFLNQNYNITIRTVDDTPISIRENGMNIYTISEYLK